jgi:hypothetical protein
MKFSRSKKFDFPPKFTIGGSQIMEVKKSHRILGFIIRDDLKWEEHVQEMVRRATKTTWVLRRMQALKIKQASLVEYWKSEGHVHIELACPVWPSWFTLAQSNALSRAQRMAAITGR